MVKKVSVICLVSLTLLLLIFFIFLFLAIRPDPDDMIISLDVREHSLYYALKARYLLSSFRTTLIFSEAIVLGGSTYDTYPIRMFLYFFLVFFAFTWTVHALLKRIFMLEPKGWKEKLLLISISLVIAGGGYFLCSSRIEIFGWLGAAGSHLVPMVFALFSILVLLRTSSSFFVDAFLLSICSLVIAGGAEHINVILLLANSYLLYLVFARKNLKIEKKKLLFFFLFHFLCFALIFSNPGVWLRMQDVTTAQAQGYDAGNFFTMFFQPYKLIGAVMALFGASALKRYFKISIPAVPAKTLLGIGLLFLCVCFLMGLMAYHSYGIGRIWLPFDLFLVTFFVLIGLRIGNGTIAHASLGIILVLVIAGYSYKHIPALNQFRKDYDGIVQQVKEAGAGEEVITDKFPEPDLVNLVELDADPHNELNILFCHFYGSKGKISVRKTYSKSR